MMTMLDTGDLPWISNLVDVIERAAGQPWRVALDELERSPVAANRLAAVTGALRRVLGNHARQAGVARRVRALVLGPPVFDAAARTARIDGVARSLGLAGHELESLMWSDLPHERPVELRRGRPSELELAAIANVQLIQRGLRRAQRVELRMWGDDGGVLRAASSRGLLATARVGDERETVLEIVGPLALFHRTSVYGRALGQLAPLLAACARFELEIHAEAYTTRIASPVLLPPAPIDRAATYVADKLARSLARLDPALDIVQAPPPIACGTYVVCPDLIVGTRWHVELVGFWTAEYIATKLARYREAGITDVILCVDETRGCADDTLPAEALGFKKRVDPAKILGRIKVG